MIRYDRREHEMLLASWWLELVKSGEIHKILDPALHSLTAFLEHFYKNTVLLFLCDEHGFTAALWFTSWYSGAIVGIWARGDKRRSIKTVSIPLLNTLYEALQVAPILVALTSQRKLLSLYEKLGFIPAGEIPGLMSGQPAYAYYVTKDTYKWTPKAHQTPSLP